VPKNPEAVCLTGINEANPLFMDIGLSEAVLVTGYIVAQENPKNAPYMALTRSGRLLWPFCWIDLQAVQIYRKFMPNRGEVDHECLCGLQRVKMYTRYLTIDFDFYAFFAL